MLMFDSDGYFLTKTPNWQNHLNPEKSINLKKTIIINGINIKNLMNSKLSWNVLRLKLKPIKNLFHNQSVPYC